jgi:hypothetical protein
MSSPVNHIAHGTPGSHSHSDRLNWCPAETVEQYVQNCRDGLERHSDRRLAKLLGISRAALWRWKLMASLPDDLFEHLLKTSARTPSAKSLANVALALRGKNQAENECCPHCGGVLRVRERLTAGYAKAVGKWIGKGGAL